MLYQLVPIIIHSYKPINIYKWQLMFGHNLFPVFVPLFSCPLAPSAGLSVSVFLSCLVPAHLLPINSLLSTLAFQPPIVQSFSPLQWYIYIYVKAYHKISFLLVPRTIPLPPACLPAH